MFLRVRVLSLLLVLGFVAGCGSEPTKPQTSGLPANDTPQNTMLRFVAAYKGKLTAEYDDLLTGDFDYEFSSSTDPSLVAKWSAGWNAEDESLSVQHQFHGGTNEYGQVEPAISKIDLVLNPTTPVDDPDRYPTTYKILVAEVGGTITVPPVPPATDPTVLVFGENRNRFYLVRGDAAKGLRPDQPADAKHWYIWHWRDESVATSAPQGPAREPLAAEVTTWGWLKAIYR